MRGGWPVFTRAVGLILMLSWVATAQAAPTPLTAGQIKTVLIGKPWNASWGTFNSQIIFRGNGEFSDGLNAPRRWHFAGNRVCITSGTPGLDGCLTFVASAGQLTSYVRLPTGMALSYHGPMP